MKYLPDSKSRLQESYNSRNKEYCAQYFTDDKRVVGKTHRTTQNERNGQCCSQHGQVMLK